ncbi:glycosyl hydrolase family 18 protein [Streptomyces syringium]|uniref:glycosyl hydrolase family 18 protein n=1 Tax=Streptomyces syringium TaxID=76729 RepID=UPI003D8FE649
MRRKPTGAYRDALAHADQLHTVSPFWYEATAADRVTAHPGAGDRTVIDGLHRAGIKVVPTVTESLDAAATARLLDDPKSRATHVDTLVRLATAHPYDGLDLDYERMNEPAAAPALLERVRTGFNTLITELCDRLHALRKECVAAVFPRSATRDDGPVHDYAHLGRTLDRLRITGYNLHNALDPVSRTPHFTYTEDGRQREVWYQDARGIAAHLPVLARYGVTGTALWALDFEEPGLWPVLAAAPTRGAGNMSSR